MHSTDLWHDDEFDHFPYDPLSSLKREHAEKGEEEGDDEEESKMLSLSASKITKLLGGEKGRMNEEKCLGKRERERERVC